MIGDIFILAGGILALIAGIGMVRFETAYARFHAAGKASPVAFLVTSFGAAMRTDYTGAAYLAIAAVAMVVTLPVGVHLLFRAVHRTSNNDHLVVDERSDADNRPGSEDSTSLFYSSGSES